MKTRAGLQMLLALALLGASSIATAETNGKTALQVAQDYYQGIAGERDFATVPMAEDLTFRGPGRTASNAQAFRKALRGLSTQVKGLELRQQLAEGEFVLTFYDLDLGAPDGPIPMAEKLRVVDGEIVDVELLFDSRRLPAAPPPTRQ